MSNGKDSFNSWIDKKDLIEEKNLNVRFFSIKMSQYFPKPFRSFRENVNVKVEMLKLMSKTVLKNVTQVDTSSFAMKTNLTSLKTKVDKLDIDKLALVPADLSILSDVAKNDVVKKTVYDKLAAKVNNIDTSDFVWKTKYRTGKTVLIKKIPEVTNFVKKKTKLTELESKIPNVSSFATKAALTAVGNKIPNVSSLVKKATLTQKSVSLKRNLPIIIMTNILSSRV